MTALNTLSREALEAMVAKFQAQAAARAPRPSIKVSAKGAVSVYGLGRYPITLYSGQWKKLIEQVPAIEAFMAEHVGELSVKA